MNEEQAHKVLQAVIGADSQVAVLNEIIDEKSEEIRQLLAQVQDWKAQFDIALNERNDVMAENASARSVHETLVRNLTSMSEFAGKAMRERDEARRERDEARRLYCEAVILHGTAHRADENGVPIEITDAAELARSLKWDCYGTEDMSER